MKAPLLELFLCMFAPPLHLCVYMQLPFFYVSEYKSSQNEITLDEDTSRHIAQVLRMKEGEKLNLTDGQGNLMTAEITGAHKKHCSVKVINSQQTVHHSPRITIAISLLKNTSRFEWFLEKATEIGIAEIIPLICERTEKQKIRYDRMTGICVSAMLQSQQTWLPVLHEPRQFGEVAIQRSENTTKLIAHCNEGNKHSLSNMKSGSFDQCQILIGPEGDFTIDEINLALQNDYAPVSLGETRLRTETAGIAALVILRLF